MLSYASIGFVRPLWKVVEETDEVGVGFSRFFLIGCFSFFIGDRNIIFPIYFRSKIIVSITTYAGSSCPIFVKWERIFTVKPQSEC